LSNTDQEARPTTNGGLLVQYNSDMKMRGLCAAILWFAVAYPCAAQLMSAAQYRDYMKGLDAAAERWQKQIKAVDVGKMNVDYSSGKTVERARGAILENLKLMRTFIEQQHSMEVLSADISIENTIGDASSPLTVLLDMLPANQEGLYWQRTLPAINTEMADLQVQLRKHIDAYANKL
jgi:hypothetical protein